MNWLKRLFGKEQAYDLAKGRGWTTEVVGEINFQEELLHLYKSHGGTEHDIKVTAILVPEENNEHDRNAVRVEIKRRPIGYLTKQMASEYRAAIGSASGRCSAKIVGGFTLDDGTRAYFGVKLNIAWPPRYKITQ